MYTSIIPSSYIMCKLHPLWRVYLRERGSRGGDFVLSIIIELIEKDIKRKNPALKVILLTDKNSGFFNHFC